MCQLLPIESTNTSTPAKPQEPVVTVKGLTVDLTGEAGTTRELLSDVSFDVLPGEIFALVGESGCGKSVTCLALARLNPEPPFRVRSGQIRVQGHDVLALGDRELRKLRGGGIAYIFQDPGASLNPVLQVGGQVAEAIRLHETVSRRAAKARVVELFRQVGIPEPALRAEAYPHQLSGGMQQRVMIAMALSCHPAVLVADEPTTALDVTVQAQILALLRQLRAEFNTAILLVTHNLGIVAGLADSAAVMYAGEIIEQAPAERLLRSPQHPYTQALLAAVPRLGMNKERLTTIPGRVPPPGQYPAGCRFAPRCASARADCACTAPSLIRTAPGQAVRCDQAAAKAS